MSLSQAGSTTHRWLRRWTSRAVISRSCDRARRSLARLDGLVLGSRHCRLVKATDVSIWGGLAAGKVFRQGAHVGHAVLGARSSGAVAPRCLGSLPRPSRPCPRGMRGSGRRHLPERINTRSSGLFDPATHSDLTDHTIACMYTSIRMYMQRRAPMRSVTCTVRMAHHAPSSHTSPRPLLRNPKV